jgi:hypothetical protein
MVELFALMLAAHFVADYPLQGEFLAKAKAQGPLRVWHLFGHSAIHGAAVLLVTGSLLLCVLETLAHTLIDESKVRGRISFATDQALHVGCKVLWLALIAGGIA